MKVLQGFGMQRSDFRHILGLPMDRVSCPDTEGRLGVPADHTRLHDILDKEHLAYYMTKWT